jgi:tellurium resistance protein TerZ
MVLDLQKGMSLDLTKIENASGLTDVAVGVNWGQIKKGGLFGFGGSSESVDLDLSAIMFDKYGKKINTIYYGNLSGRGVRHSGDDRSGDDEADDKDNETITVNLAETAPDVFKIVFVLVSFKGQDFVELPYAAMNLYNTSSGKIKLANSNIDISKDTRFKGKVSMVFATLEKINGSWSYRVIAEPTNKRDLSDLTSICTTI